MILTDKRVLLVVVDMDGYSFISFPFEKVNPIILRKRRGEEIHVSQYSIF